MPIAVELVEVAERLVALDRVGEARASEKLALEANSVGPQPASLPSRLSEVQSKKLEAEILESKLKAAGISPRDIPLSEKDAVREYLNIVGRPIHALCSDDRFAKLHGEFKFLKSDLRSVNKMHESVWLKHLENDRELQNIYGNPPEDLSYSKRFLWRKPQYKEIMDARSALILKSADMDFAEKSLVARIRDTVYKPLNEFTKASGIPKIQYQAFSQENRPNRIGPNTIGCYFVFGYNIATRIDNFEGDGLAAIGVTYHELQHAQQSTVLTRFFADDLKIDVEATPDEMKTLCERIDTRRYSSARADFILGALRIRNGIPLSTVQNSRAAILFNAGLKYDSRSDDPQAYAENAKELEANLAMLRAEVMALESPDILK